MGSNPLPFPFDHAPIGQYHHRNNSCSTVNVNIMPSLCKVRISDLIQDGKMTARGSLPTASSTAAAGAGAGASQRRVHPFTSNPTSGHTPLQVKSETKSNRLHSNVYGALTATTRDRTDSDNSKSAATENSLLNKEDKENSKSNASSISIATNSNETKAHNRSKKEKRMTLDAYFVRPPPSKNRNEMSDDDVDDDEDYTELHNDSSKKKQRKLLTLNENAKPLHVRIPFIDNEKPVDVAIVSHCISNKYIDVNEPLALSGEVLYPASSRTAIERFLPGFGRYIH
jgi:hypothetical protein